MWSSKTTMLVVLTVIVVVAFTTTGVSAKQQFKRDIMYPNFHEPPIHYEGPHAGTYPQGPYRGRGPHKHGHAHRARPGPETTDSNVIPIDLLNRLNDIDVIADFYALVSGAENNTEFGAITLGNRVGFGDERKSVVQPKIAKCMPEEKTVELQVENSEPSMFYYPKCTRVKLCGGCCNTEVMSCQPTDSQSINFQVMVSEYSSAIKSFKFIRKEIVTVEEHTKCKCMCRIQEKDCSKLQVYRPNECRCDCTNVDERSKCMNDNDTKVWDSNNCACICRETRDCSTGFVFNPLTCRCTALPDRVTRRHISNSDLELQLRLRRGDKPGIKHQPRPVLPML